MLCENDFFWSDSLQLILRSFEKGLFELFFLRNGLGVEHFPIFGRLFTSDLCLHTSAQNVGEKELQGCISQNAGIVRGRVLG